MVLVTALDRQIYDLPIGFPVVAAAIVAGLCEYAKLDAEVALAVRAALVARLKTGRWLAVFLNATWETLDAMGAREALVAYADHWIGSDGSAWKEPPADRYEIVTKLTHFLERAGESERADAARVRLSWADVGYTGHKEYGLNQPLEWFAALAKTRPTAWRSEGLRLLALSREASRTGDNRISWELGDEVLTAACVEGPSAVARLLFADNTAVGAGDHAVASGLIGLLSRVRLERDDLLAFWGFCTGQLCWQVRNDRHRLVEVREAILGAGREIGADLTMAMRSAAPAEFACELDKDDGRTGATRDDGQLDALPVLEAMRVACDGADWHGVSITLARVARDEPNRVSEATAFAWSALSRREERIWWYDRPGRAYEAVFPRITPTQRWEAVTRAVTCATFDTPSYRTSTLAENLDSFCRLAATIDGADAVRDGLVRLLDMQEAWISGGGRLPPVQPIPLAEDRLVRTWGKLLVELLLQLLAYDEQGYVQSALRGLFRLLMLDASLYRHTVACLRIAEPEVRRRFLLIAEALASESGADALREWLEEEIASPQLDIALSSWAALRFGHRVLGLAPPTWPQSQNDDGPVIVRAAPPLLERPSEQRGLQSVAGRASHSVLNQLKAACCDEVEDLRSELAASVRDDLPVPRPKRTRDVHVGDMGPSRSGDAELERLFALLRARERQGRFSGVPLSRLVQAIVPFADPFIFLRSPAPFAKADSWPVDKELDALLSSKSVVWSDQVASLMAADLGPAVRLVAGTLRTFSDKWDVRVQVNHVVAGPSSGANRQPFMLCARASLAFDDDDDVIASAEDMNQEWLTRRVGGLILFVDATLDLFPGRAWAGELGWKPSLRDPLVWERDGQRAAWFERLRGPVRQIYPGDFLYRQPTVARWVCRAEEWQRIETIVGEPSRRVESEAAAHREW